MISTSFRVTMCLLAYAGWTQLTFRSSRRFPGAEVGVMRWVRLISSYPLGENLAMYQKM